MVTGTQVVATGRTLLGRLAYSNAWYKPTLAQITSYGSADCSDFTHAIYRHHRILIGGMAREQALDGIEVASWSGHPRDSVAAYNKIAFKVRAGDLVCMAIDQQRFPGVYSHVEMIMADGSGNCIGHGGPGRGPTISNLGNRWLLPQATKWTIRRVIKTSTKDKIKETIVALTKTQAKALSNINSKADNVNYAISKIALPALARLDNFRVATTNRLNTIVGELAGIKTAIDQLSKGTIDMEQITAAAEKGAREGAIAINAEAVASELEVTTKGGK